MSSPPSNPRVGLGVDHRSGKEHTSVISQVNCPLGRSTPVSKALGSYVEITSFKLNPIQRVLGQKGAGSVRVATDIHYYGGARPWGNG
jgi:hypothetical protein